MTSIKSLRLVPLLLLALLLVGCNVSLASDITPPPNYVAPSPVVEQSSVSSGPLYPLVAPDPSKGAAIFAEKCAPCHGATGLGDGPRSAQLPTPPPALGDPSVARQAIPAEWYRIVTVGNLEKLMPPFSSLSDSERWDVVTYAFSLSVSPDQLVVAGEMYQVFCMACHGEQGSGDGPQSAGNIQSFGDLERMAAQTQAQIYDRITEGSGMSMPGYKKDMTDDQRWAMAAYVRQFAYAGSAGQPAGVEASNDAAPTAAATDQAIAGLGKISGQLANGSGGDVPSGIEVFLHGFDEMSNVISGTTMTEAGGAFVFENVAMPEGRAFLATVQFDGATYGSDIVSVEPGMTNLVLPITVYNSTTDPSILVVDRLHLFFEFIDAQTIRVAELYIISNSTGKAVVPKGEIEPSLTFAVPAGASNLQFQDGAMGERYVPTADGFGDLSIIAPGQSVYQVLFAYEMPYDRKLDLEHRLNLTTQAVVVMVPAGSIKVKADGLQESGTRDVQGMSFQQYSLSGLQAGETLKMNITGKPVDASPSVTAGNSNELVIGLAALGLVLITAGGWFYLRNRRPQDDDEFDDEDETPVAPAAVETPESLMDAILALDDLYAANQLPEEAYRQRRATLKARLKELVG